jgi:hypothetical protein
MVLTGIKRCSRGQLWYVLELLKAGADCNQERHCWRDGAHRINRRVLVEHQSRGLLQCPILSHGLGVQNKEPLIL